MARRKLLDILSPAEPQAAENPVADLAESPVGELRIEAAQAETSPPEPALPDSPLEDGNGITAVLNEAEQANLQAEQALQDEGVTVKPMERERRVRTREQLARAARRQRDYGRKLLARRTNGFASMICEVKINNGVLAASFERFFPVIDWCAYLVARHGGATLGDDTAQQILERMEAMALEALEDRKKDLSAAQAVIGEVSVKMGDEFVQPQFVQPAFAGAVQIRTPQARRALDLFLTSDAILTEAETLYWNQMRTLSEKNDESLHAKKAVNPLFRFSASTIRHLYRRMRDRFDVEVTTEHAKVERKEEHKEASKVDRSMEELVPA